MQLILDEIAEAHEYVHWKNFDSYTNFYPHSMSSRIRVYPL